jgi:hypothetical protein
VCTPGAKKPSGSEDLGNGFKKMAVVLAIIPTLDTVIINGRGGTSFKTPAEFKKSIQVFAIKADIFKTY